MDWMFLPFRRYAEFSGRSQRQEYWMFSLLYLIVLIATGLIMIAGAIGLEKDQAPGPVFWIGAGLLTLFIVAGIIPSIAVTVRRLHDQNLSGWMYLLSFIPYIGGFVLLVFMFIDGTPGDNRFGPDPKGRGHADVFG
jgi:uncharacterized membrane protein YhaH (DUF805 family)